MNERPSRRVQLFAVIRKETLQTVRDKRMMFLLLLAPALQLVVFGYAVDFGVDRVPTVIVDQDGSAASREHARRLVADQTLLRVADATDPAAADRALERGEAAAALVFPKGLSRDLDRGEPAEVQVIIDGTDPNRATVAVAAASAYFAEAGLELARERAALQPGAPRPGDLRLAPRIWYNPTLDSPPFMIPGVLALLLVVVTTIVAAMGLAREREMGTLEQVLVTPIHPGLLLVGKLLPFVVIGLVDVGLGLAVGAWIFEVPLRGNLGLVMTATVLYLMTTIGTGLLISTVSRTQQQSFLGGFLFAMPALLLSGVMTPIRGMPEWLQAITLLNPVRYYVEIMRSCLLKGTGLAELWPQLLALLVFGLALMVTATLRFHKRTA
jgi:ABC-2 type transport system permease protein